MHTTPPSRHKHTQPRGLEWSELEVFHWSTFLTRSTTGTEVHGIIPSSVITRSTKSGGVTSYTRLSRPSEGTSCQCSSCVFPLRVTIRSSGSSGNYMRSELSNVCDDMKNSLTECENSTNEAAGCHLHTKFIGHKGIRLHPLTELVRLTAHQHRHIKGFGHQSYLWRPHTRHDVTVGQQSMSTKKHLRYLRGPRSSFY